MAAGLGIPMTVLDLGGGYPGDVPLAAAAAAVAAAVGEIVISLTCLSIHVETTYMY